MEVCEGANDNVKRNANRRENVSVGLKWLLELTHTSLLIQIGLTLEGLLYIHLLLTRAL